MVIAAIILTFDNDGSKSLSCHLIFGCSPGFSCLLLFILLFYVPIVVNMLELANRRLDAVVDAIRIIDGRCRVRVNIVILSYTMRCQYR